MLDLLQIQKIASAAEAGRVAGLTGRTDNPFSGNEDLRKAFHYGWTIGSSEVSRIPGGRYFTVQELLDSAI